MAPGYKATGLGAQQHLKNVPSGAQGGGGEGEQLLDLRFGALLLEDYGVAAVVGLEEGVDGADEGGGGEKGGGSLFGLLIKRILSTTKLT